MKGNIWRRAAASALSLALAISLLPPLPTDAATSTAPKLNIMLDPGHDAHHGGTHYGSLEEHVVTFKIAEYCKAALDGYNVNVYMTRDSMACPFPGSKQMEDLAARVQKAVHTGCSAYISFHINDTVSRRGNGATVYYQTADYRPDLSALSGGLASAIEDRLCALGLRRCGVFAAYSKTEKNPDGSAADDFKVIRESKYYGIPAVLIEHAYMVADNSYLSSEDALRRLGEADAAAIISYYGLEKTSAIREQLKTEYQGAFDARYYADCYPDLFAAFGYDADSLLQHYLICGLREGRVASPVFDVNYYRTTYPDLAAAFGDDLSAYARHFALCGMREGRAGNGAFDVAGYMSRYPDLTAAFGADTMLYYLHYIACGYYEGRDAGPSGEAVPEVASGAEEESAQDGQ